jgi:hypothetical protein
MITSSSFHWFGVHRPDIPPQKMTESREKSPVAGQSATVRARYVQITDGRAAESGGDGQLAAVVAVARRVAGGGYPRWG